MVPQLVFLTEEQSMEALLEVLLPKLLPAEVSCIIIPHQGKQDLVKSIPIKLRGWNIPAKFVILHDQDSNDCYQLKSELVSLCNQAGKPESTVRIVCHELEAWFLGDLNAVGRAYNDPRIAGLQTRSKYRDPDKIINAKEELRKIAPYHQVISGSRMIGKYMSLQKDDNLSQSFRLFINSIRNLVEHIIDDAVDK